MNGIERWFERYEGGRVKQIGMSMQVGRTTGQERPTFSAEVVRQAGARK